MTKSNVNIRRTETITSLETYGILFGIGVLLGLFYYGGLWFTVNRLRKTAWPGLLTLASFLVRTVLVALAFIGLMQGSAIRLIVMLLGFLTIRLVMVRSLGSENTVNWRSLLKGDFPP